MDEYPVTWQYILNTENHRDYYGNISIARKIAEKLGYCLTA